MAELPPHFSDSLANAETIIFFKQHVESGLQMSAVVALELWHLPRPLHMHPAASKRSSVHAGSYAIQTQHGAAGFHMLQSCEMQTKS